MAYNTEAILRDTNGDPIPQYYDTVAGEFKPLTEDEISALASVDVDSLPALPAGTNAIGSVDVDNFPTSIEVDNLTGESLDVQVTGSNMELWGADVGSRPAYNAVSVGTVFIAINGGAHEAWQSDGTEWVEV